MPSWWQPRRLARTWWTASSRVCRASRIQHHAHIYLGGKNVEMYHFGRAHTNGDMVVLFPADRTLAAGDMFTFGEATPQLIDYAGGGSGKEWPKTLESALELRL